VVVQLCLPVESRDVTLYTYIFKQNYLDFILYIICFNFIKNSDCNKNRKKKKSPCTVIPRLMSDPAN